MNRPTHDLSSAFGSAAAGLRPARRRRRSAPNDDRTEPPAPEPEVRGTADEADESDETDAVTDEGSDADDGSATADNSATDDSSGTDDESDAAATDHTDDVRSGAIPTDDRTRRRTTADDARTNGRSPARPRAGPGQERNGRVEPRRSRERSERGERTEPAPRSARTPRPRYGEVRLRDPRQLDLLILAIVADRPENGRVVHDLLRERSGGVFRPSLQGTYHRLHGLKNDRLITLGPGRRHYRLTPLGERILASRRREWAAFAHGFDSVVGRPGS